MSVERRTWPLATRQKEMKGGGLKIENWKMERAGSRWMIFSFACLNLVQAKMPRRSMQASKCKRIFIPPPMWGRPPACRFRDPLDVCDRSRNRRFRHRQTGGLPHTFAAGLQNRWYRDAPCKCRDSFSLQPQSGLGFPARMQRKNAVTGRLR